MKFKSLIVFTIILSCLSLTAYAKDKDVIAVWMLEEGKGDLVKDTTGNGHEGKIIGAKWVEGKFGKALQFNGTSDFIEVPHDDTLSLQTYTIIATFKIPAAPTGWYTIICKDTAGPIRTYGLFVGTNGLLNCSFSTGNQWRGIYDINVDPDLDTRVDDGKWHTVAIAYDMKTYRVYIDDKLEAQKKITDKPDAADMTVTIGSWHGGGWINGLIDEIYLSERALSEAEIQKFSSGIATASPVYTKNKLAVTWGHIKL
ncbi:LamG domain-containing protein [Candidatus Poribacteria bacterium]|nr:LamG domain-containing protein [Candidatus Poribacteria bacterium]